MTLSLPGLRGSVRSTSPDLETVGFTVTTPRVVCLANVQVDTHFAEVAVDLMGSIDDVAFVVYFVHPGRDVPPGRMPGRLANQRCGVISINLQRTVDLFRKQQPGDGPFKQRLVEFLANHVDSKQWVFHPRYESAKASAANRPVYVGSASSRAAGVASAEFKCVSCGSTSIADAESRPSCPNCRSPLYMRLVRKVTR